MVRSIIDGALTRLRPNIDDRIGSKSWVRAHGAQRRYWRRGATAFGHGGHRRDSIVNLANTGSAACTLSTRA